MNLDENEFEENAPAAKPKKLSRKEKKALKASRKEEARAKKEKIKMERAEKKSGGEKVSAAPDAPVSAATPQPESQSEPPEETTVHLEPAPIPSIPPPDYTLWEKISPPARRRRQITNMETGFREVLGLVQSMRENQEVLLESFQKLPEAVESVKKLADHSARQSELLEAMNSQAEDGPLSGKFNETLSSMDKTTQLLLERAQRSEERLYGMLRRAQRRIAFMTLMVLLLFLGAVAGGLFFVFPEETRSWLDGNGFRSSEEQQEPAGADVIEKEPPTPSPTQVPASTEVPQMAEETGPAPTPAEETEAVDEDVETEATSDLGAELEDIVAPVVEEMEESEPTPTPKPTAVPRPSPTPDVAENPEVIEPAEPEETPPADVAEDGADTTNELP